MKNFLYFMLGFFIIGSSTYAFSSSLYVKKPSSTSITFCAQSLSECDKFCLNHGSLRSFSCLGDSWLDSVGLKKTTCVCGDD